MKVYERAAKSVILLKYFEQMTSACMHLKLTLYIFISICYVLPIYHSAVHRLLKDASLPSGIYDKGLDLRA